MGEENNVTQKCNKISSLPTNRFRPKISNTEAAALNAGTVGFDGNIFQGNPTLKYLTEKYDVQLTKVRVRITY
jgi:hypothetical protein